MFVNLINSTRYPFAAISSAPTTFHRSQNVKADDYEESHANQISWLHREPILVVIVKSGCSMDHESKIKAGELLLQKAAGALCRYHDARKSLALSSEVEGLRRKSEKLIKELKEFLLQNPEL